MQWTECQADSTAWQLRTTWHDQFPHIGRMDKLSRDRRSLNMSRIRGKNTRPELIVRRLLHSMGYRFRLHRKDLPGKPDIVLPKHRTVVLVHGCFWHGCAKCDRGTRVPKTNTEFWVQKIEGNRRRDSEAREKLIGLGWRVVVLWQCEMVNPDASENPSAGNFTDRRTTRKGDPPLACVIDPFSCGGGMSQGFQTQLPFRIPGAVDAEIGESGTHAHRKAIARSSLPRQDTRRERRRPACGGSVCNDATRRNDDFGEDDGG